MRRAWVAFWNFYERHYTLNVTASLGLFLFQMVHLFWLTTNVILVRILGQPLFEFTGIWQYVIVAVDYTEIPALVAVSFIYVNELRKKFSFKSVMYLAFLNSQWLHLLWITDEFVVHTFLEGVPGETVLPVWLAWVAILIDYLEVPVIVDTVGKVTRAFRRGEKIVLD